MNDGPAEAVTISDIPLVTKVLVVPYGADVAIADATWQDYPAWEEHADAQWVAFRAFSLIDPDNPPYPGIAVRTRPGTGSEVPPDVQVEMWHEEVPSGLRMVHSMPDCDRYALPDDCVNQDVGVLAMTGPQS